MKKIENNKEYTLVLSLDNELFNSIEYNETNKSTVFMRSNA